MPTVNAGATAMKLVWAAASPFARKCMIVAKELGLDDRIETVSGAGTPLAPAEATRANNPLAKLPSLARDDGPAIYDSAVICQYLTSLAPGQTLLPDGGEARWSVLTLEALADGICDSAVGVRYEMALRDPAQQSQAWMDAQMAKVDGGLDALEAAGSDMEGDAFTLGHAAVICALGYLDFRYPDKDWRGSRPALATWYESVSARDSVKSTLPA